MLTLPPTVKVMVCAVPEEMPGPSMGWRALRVPHMSTSHKHQKSAAPRSLDINALRPLLASLIADGQVDEALDQVFKLLLALRDDNALMTFRLAKLLREKFGRNSEKISREQLKPLLIYTGVSPLKTPCPLHYTPPYPARGQKER